MAKERPRFHLSEVPPGSTNSCRGAACARLAPAGERRRLNLIHGARTIRPF